MTSGKSIKTLTLTFALVICPTAFAGGVPKPENLGKIINTKADETDPFLTSDGKRFLYASNATKNLDLMITVREKIASPWTKAISLGKFNSGDDDRSPHFAKGTQATALYYASNRLADPNLKVPKNFDIFLREGPREPFRLRLINTEADELHPWMSVRTKEFFFSRKTKDGWQVFVSKANTFAGIAPGEAIKEIPAGFSHATVSPDGLIMYVQGPLKDGRTGLYRTTRKRVAAAWAKPEPLANLNDGKAKRGDMAPSLSPSGRYLYFASDRVGGEGGLDIWMVKTAGLKTK